MNKKTCVFNHNLLLKKYKSSPDLFSRYIVVVFYHYYFLSFGVDLSLPHSTISTPPTFFGCLEKAATFTLRSSSHTPLTSSASGCSSASAGVCTSSCVKCSIKSSFLNTLRIVSRYFEKYIQKCSHKKLNRKGCDNQQCNI